MARKRNAELLAAEQSTLESDDDSGPPQKKTKTKSSRILDLDSEEEGLVDTLGANHSENGSEMDGKSPNY